MTISVQHYMPILKWRQGEYQALYRLSKSVRSLIIPLIIIPPIEYDFEEQRMKKTVQAHTGPIPKRIITKWEKRPALIDVHESLQTEHMDSGPTVIRYIFQELNKAGSTPIPVTGISRSEAYTNDIRFIMASDGRGCAVRVTLEQLISMDINSRLSTLFHDLAGKRQEIDLVVDLGLVDTYEPYQQFTNALAHALGGLDGLDEFRSLVVAGTSLRLSETRPPGAILPRHEWLAYLHLLDTLETANQRAPAFADYATEPPGFIDLDWRLIKAAGKIVYTAGDKWLIRKGGAFRGNEAQMTEHCNAILTSNHYMGADYSHGDRRIKDTAEGKENTGTLSTWKQVGMNHHLTMTADQISSLHES